MLEEKEIWTAFEAGRFVCLLDGLDELDRERRTAICRDILRLGEEFPASQLVVSSRPDGEVGSWSQFTEFSLSPLSAQKAEQLVQKLPADAGLKAKFVAELRNNLYEEHESFLSNPLLLSIMLLTFGQTAHVPTKQSVFYGQAYAVLFQQHDALKAGYQRSRECGLDISDFASVFSAFSYLSYDRGELSFAHMKGLELLEEAKQLVHCKYDAGAVLNDSLSAVCLLVHDGLEVTFAHRSFQEYFAARFISKAPSAAP